MPAELTLTLADYVVLNAVPFEWTDENFVGAEIARGLDVKSGVTMRRISRFVAVGLVERRPGAAVAEKTEVRRIVK